MFKSFGLPELLVVLLLVILLFGVGRIGKISKELGSGIRSFKEGLQGKSEDQPNNKEGDDKEEDKKEN